MENAQENDLEIEVNLKFKILNFKDLLPTIIVTHHRFTKYSSLLPRIVDGYIVLIKINQINHRHY